MDNDDIGDPQPHIDNLGCQSWGAMTPRLGKPNMGIHDPDYS